MTHRKVQSLVESKPSIVLEMTDLYMEVIMTDLNVLLSGEIDGSIGNPCIVKRTIDGLDEPYRSKLRDLVNTRWADGGLTETALSKLMQHAGLTCSATMLSRHRRGVCTCPTER